MKPFLIVIIALVFFNPNWVSAQMNTGGYLNTSASIELQPNFPAPGKAVKAKLNDFRPATSGSLLNWFVDGVEIIESRNSREANFTAGEIGKRQVISVVITKQSGTTETVESAIVPLILDIVIEPQTHVPDFYEGRALPSLGSTVNATGLIYGIPVNESELVYTWRIERKVIGSSGIRGGKQVSFVVPMGEELMLSLQVADLRGKVLAGRALYLPSVEPDILFYEVSPLFGSGRHALSNPFPFVGNSLTIKAEPYNLDTKTFNNPDISIWKINGSESRNNSSNPYEATLQKTGIGSSANVEYHVRSTSQILQGTKKSIKINF